MIGTYNSSDMKDTRPLFITTILNCFCWDKWAHRMCCFGMIVSIFSSTNFAQEIHMDRIDCPVHVMSPDRSRFLSTIDEKPNSSWSARFGGRDVLFGYSADGVPQDVALIAGSRFHDEAVFVAQETDRIAWGIRFWDTCFISEPYSSIVGYFGGLQALLYIDQGDPAIQQWHTLSSSKNCVLLDGLWHNGALWIAAEVEGRWALDKRVMEEVPRALVLMKLSADGELLHNDIYPVGGRVHETRLLVWGDDVVAIIGYNQSLDVHGHLFRTRQSSITNTVLLRLTNHLTITDTLHVKSALNNSVLVKSSADDSMELIVNYSGQLTVDHRRYPGKSFGQQSLRLVLCNGLHVCEDELWTAAVHGTIHHMIKDVYVGKGHFDHLPESDSAAYWLWWEDSLFIRMYAPMMEIHQLFFLSARGIRLIGRARGEVTIGTLHASPGEEEIIDFIVDVELQPQVDTITVVNSIYPNPASAELKISGIDDQSVTYSIYDMTGRLIETGHTNGYIHMDHLSSAEYILTWTIDGRSYIERFIKVSE